MTEVLLIAYGLGVLFFFGYLMPTARERAAVKSRWWLAFGIAAGAVLALVWPISFAISAGVEFRGDDKKVAKE